MERMTAAEYNKSAKKCKKITAETSEKRAIKDYLKIKGWFVYPNTAGFASYKGVPDFTAIKNGCVVQIEVKATGGKQSPGQVQFQQDWSAYGGNYICGNCDRVMQDIGYLHLGEILS
jgi:hypothetical protein